MIRLCFCYVVYKENNMIAHLIKSIENARNGYSNLPAWILAMEGMSGARNRHFYNNICSKPGLNYLEVGCWKGSSTCSALHGNSINATVVDNFEQWGDVSNEFMENLKNTNHKGGVNLILEDCFKVDVSAIPKIDVYLYDGPHEDLSHARCLKYYDACLKDEFVFIVDDYSWEHVKRDTLVALKGYDIIFQHEIDDDTNQGGWWNGIGIFLLRKK